MKRILDYVLSIFGLIGMIVGGLAYLDAYYAHQDDVVRRDLLSQSTRYAEIEKYYTDELREGTLLTESQLKRLDTVQAQQERIAEILKEE